MEKTRLQRTQSHLHPRQETTLVLNSWDRLFWQWNLN